MALIVGSLLMAELESALTSLDVAETNFIPECTARHIDGARKSLALVQTSLATATCNEMDQTEIAINLRELERRLSLLT